MFSYIKKGLFSFFKKSPVVQKAQTINLLPTIFSEKLPELERLWKVTEKQIQDAIGSSHVLASKYGDTRSFSNGVFQKVAQQINSVIFNIKCGLNGDAKCAEWLKSNLSHVAKVVKKFRYDAERDILWNSNISNKYPSVGLFVNISEMLEHLAGFAASI